MESEEDKDSDEEARVLMANSPKDVNIGMFRKLLTKGVTNEMNLP